MGYGVRLSGSSIRSRRIWSDYSWNGGTKIGEDQQYGMGLRTIGQILKHSWV